MVLAVVVAVPPERVQAVAACASGLAPAVHARAFVRARLVHVNELTARHAVIVRKERLRVQFWAPFCDIKRCY